MSTSPKHLTHFEGGNALSAFRAQALLPRLQAVQPRISAVHARHVHWVWSDHPLAGGEQDKLEALLRYGDPYGGPADEYQRMYDGLVEVIDAGLERIIALAGGIKN